MRHGRILDRLCEEEPSATLQQLLEIAANVNKESTIKQNSTVAMYTNSIRKNSNINGPKTAQRALKQDVNKSFSRNNRDEGYFKESYRATGQGLNQVEEGQSAKVLSLR